MRIIHLYTVQNNVKWNDKWVVNLWSVLCSQDIIAKEQI